MPTTLPIYISTLPLLAVALWCFTLVFPTHWFGQRAKEHGLLQSFRLIILGHGILGLSYFLCAHPFSSVENVSRVLLGCGALASLLVMQGMMRLLSPRAGWFEQLARAAIVALGAAVCLFPMQFVSGWHQDPFAGYILDSLGPQESNYSIFAGLLMLSVLIPSWAIWRQRKSWLSPYVFHLLVAIWATVIMGFVDAGLTASKINWPSTIWVGIGISNALLLNILNRHYHQALRRAEMAEQEKSQLQNRLIHDGMTGLYTRAYGLERLDNLLNDQAAPLSVIFVDLDDLKYWNDSHSHATGDHVIAAVAEIIRESLRAEDLPARYAGDEFFAVLPKTSIEDALKVAQRVQNKLESSPIHPARPVTASIGVAQRQAQESADQLIHRADQATYLSKRRGKNQVSVAQG